MIKHVIIWKLKESVENKEETMKSIKSALEKMSYTYKKAVNKLYFIILYQLLILSRSNQLFNYFFFTLNCCCR